MSLKILVTGGAGYVGAALVEQLGKLPSVAEIKVYDNLFLPTRDFFFNTFLNKEKVKFVPAYTPGSSYGEEKPAKYVVDKSKYYFKNQDKLVEFPEKKSELFKLFPNNKEAIELYLKENKVKFNEDSSLLLLTNFLNTL